VRVPWARCDWAWCAPHCRCSGVRTAQFGVDPVRRLAICSKDAQEMGYQIEGTTTGLPAFFCARRVVRWALRRGDLFICRNCLPRSVKSLGSVREPVDPRVSRSSWEIPLLAIGVVLFVGGILLATDCGLNVFGGCGTGPGGMMAAFGALLLAVGIGEMSQTKPLSTPSALPTKTRPTSRVRPRQLKEWKPPASVSRPPTRLAPASPSLSPLPRASTFDWFCPRCGAANVRMRLVCHECGQPLPP
jgi:hypothetical protein